MFRCFLIATLIFQSILWYLFRASSSENLILSIKSKFGELYVDEVPSVLGVAPFPSCVSKNFVVFPFVVTAGVSAGTCFATELI